MLKLDLRQRKNGWWYCSKGFHWLKHGGWFYFDIKHPRKTIQWWLRFSIIVPKSRGWRWD